MSDFQFWSFFVGAVVVMIILLKKLRRIHARDRDRSGNFCGRGNCDGAGEGMNRFLEKWVDGMYVLFLITSAVGVAVGLAELVTRFPIAMLFTLLWAFAFVLVPWLLGYAFQFIKKRKP